jgi:large repetitive protein
MRKLPALSVCGGTMFVLLLLVGEASADITNNATATATYNATPITSNVSSASVPVTPQSATLLVTKVADDTTQVVAGQTVTYTYTIQNSGNVTLTNVSLADAHNGSGAPVPVPGGGIVSNDVAPLNNSTDGNSADSVWDTLAPGDTVTFTSTYIVTQNDVDTKQ